MIDVDPLAPTVPVATDRIAVIDTIEGTTLTYEELDRQVDAIATGLLQHGAKAGDRIVVTTGISMYTPSLILGTWRMGGIVVPMDPTLDSDRFADRLDRIAATVIVGGSPVVSDQVPVVAFGSLATTTPTDISSDRKPDDLAAILFTSGTTGVAKAVGLTARNLQTNAIASALRLGVDHTDRWITCLKPHHMGGFAPIIRSVVYGTAVVLLPFESSTITNAITDHEATGISIVPTMLQRLLNEDVPLEQCRAVLIGGDVTPPDLVRRSLDRGVPIYVSYGMTETASQIATATPDELASDPNTVGHPLKWTRLSVSGGPPGQIVVDGPTVAAGYVQGAAIDSFGGSFDTGDLGVISEHRRLTVVGRADDRIVSGGVTVDPRAVEETIQKLEGVNDVAIVGIEDPEWGELVGAVVTPSEAPVDSRRLSELSTLQPAERPRTIVCTNDLPRTPSGTVDRCAVRRILEEE